MLEKHKNVDFSNEELNRYDIWVIKSLRNKVSGEIITDFTEDQIQDNYQNDNWVHEIYEVERTTDNIIFKIGDEIKMKWDDKPFIEIGYFNVSNVQLRVNFRKLGIPFTDDFELF